jgi:GAF domain-containing protein
MGITVFTPAPLLENEGKRSEAAVQSGLVNRVRDPRLTAIALEARHLLKARWSGVTVMVGDIQHVVASSGGMIGMYRRATSLSSYNIYEPDVPFVVLDTMIDERFSGNPFVDNGLIRFFASATILDRAGYAVGALCVTDRVARTSFVVDDATILRRLANDIVATLP